MGREVARKLRAFDADVIAVSRAGVDPHVSQIYPREKICDALAISDALIICVNSEASTHHLIGARELSALKPGSFVVNMSRGEIIHEAGTVRMGTDPKTSVLNKFSQAHEVENLFVADAAPFNGNPDKNVTLTIVANAWRAASHLADEITKGNV